MSVYVYDQSGTIVEERPDAEVIQAGKDVFQFNKANPGTPRKVVRASSFPPPGMVFDVSLGDLRNKNITDVYNSGVLNLESGYVLQQGPAGTRIVGPHQKLDGAGEVVEKTINEKIADGLVAFDPVTQKVENNEIVLKTRQELLDGGQLTQDGLRESEMQRLRREVETYFGETKTTNGYRLDNLARQKAALSMQYRQLADTDPVKADLLSKELIYPDTICDEILAAVEVVQSAYSQAKAAVESAYTGQQSVAQYEAIQLANYIV